MTLIDSEPVSVPMGYAVLSTTLFVFRALLLLKRTPTLFENDRRFPAIKKKSVALSSNIWNLYISSYTISH